MKCESCLENVKIKDFASLNFSLLKKSIKIPLDKDNYKIFYVLNLNKNLNIWKIIYNKNAGWNAIFTNEKET